MMVTKRWIVEGRVQGVGFRAHTERKAKELGLKGWVQNLANGCVETLAQGEDQNVNAFYQWLQTGPAHGKVDKVNEVPNTDSESFFDFSIRR